MSDVMLFGVLRMPYEMAMSTELSRFQFYQRAQEAVDRIESMEASATAGAAQAGAAIPFQQRVQPWMMECFGAEISADVIERNHRFFEESTELVQACGMTASEAHQLVDYTYGRPVGEKQQEVGGVMVTLAALCLAQGMDMHAAGETELARIWTKVDKIRAKQAAKPKHSPLPEATPTSAEGAAEQATHTAAVQAAIERCAKAAEGFQQSRDWVPGSLYDTLRREVAAAIRALKPEDGAPPTAKES